MIALNDVIDRIDDRLNPIIVKELRQVVRGKFFWGLLILFLGIQCVVLSLSIADRGLTNRSVGADTLSFLFVILFLASFAMIPLYSGFRFARERNEGSDELLFITTITPQSIIMGKFSASMIFILLIYSAFAPFMAMTFFLSGVDFTVTFVVLIFGLLVSACGTMLQIAFASMAGDNNAMQIFRVMGFVFQIIVFFSLAGVCSDMVSHGVSRFFGSANFLSSFLSFASVMVMITYFLYIAASAVISPAGTNKMLPVRRNFVFLWGLSFALAAYWAVTFSDVKIFFFWGGVVNVALGWFAFVAVSERDHVSERVARELPCGFFKRLFAFVFFSGAAGGLTWVFCMSLLTISLGSLLGELMPAVSTSEPLRREFADFTIGLMAYSFAYSLIAAFIRRNFLAEYIDIRNTWVIALLTCVVFSIAPIFVGIFMGADSNLLMVGNPMMLLQSQSKGEGLLFAFITALLGVFINLKWFFAQVREFFSVANPSELPPEAEQPR
ncbi:MAG: hypothetical protein EOM80_01615 [Erysipelotrichia bacterium]|nr:hypothetical protein [Erysipelotrichia bacterium]